MLFQRQQVQIAGDHERGPALDRRRHVLVIIGIVTDTFDLTLNGIGFEEWSGRSPDAVRLAVSSVEVAMQPAIRSAGGTLIGEPVPSARRVGNQAPPFGSPTF